MLISGASKQIFEQCLLADWLFPDLLHIKCARCSFGGRCDISFNPNIISDEVLPASDYQPPRTLYMSVWRKLSLSALCCLFN